MAGRFDDCCSDDLFLRHGVMSRQGLPDPRKNPEMAPPALCLARGFPTARLPEHGLRGNLDYEPHFLRPRPSVAGERLATVKRHPGYTVLQSAPSYAAALHVIGEGEDAESGILPIWSRWNLRCRNRDREHACRKA